jgi:hypothetical protein
MRSRPGFPTRRASALICMAALIANVIKASSPRAAHKGRTYGRTAPVWGQQRKRAPLTAGSFHIWESQESVSRRVGISPDAPDPDLSPLFMGAVSRLRRQRAGRLPGDPRLRPRKQHERRLHLVRGDRPHDHRRQEDAPKRDEIGKVQDRALSRRVRRHLEHATDRLATSGEKPAPPLRCKTSGGTCVIPC